MKNKDTILTFTLNKTLYKLLTPSNSTHRKIGLLNHISLANEEGLAYKKTRIFHTFGMNFPITVVCLNKEKESITPPKVIPKDHIFISPSGTMWTLELNENAFVSLNNGEIKRANKKLCMLSKETSKWIYLGIKNLKYLLFALFLSFFCFKVFASEEVNMSSNKAKVFDLGRPPLSIQISDPDIVEAQRVGVSNSIKLIPKQEGDSEITIQYPSGDERILNVHIGSKNRYSESSPLSPYMKTIGQNNTNRFNDILIHKVNAISGLKSSFSGNKILILGEIKGVSQLFELSKIILIEPTLFYPAYKIPSKIENNLISMAQSQLKLFGERNLKIINQQGLYTVIGVPSTPAGKLKAWNYLSAFIPNMVDGMSLQVGDSSLVQINLDFLELGEGKNTDFGFKNSLMSGANGNLNFPSGLISNSNLEPTLQIGAISALFKAIQASSYARELAKPVVITRSGEKASFLAGGEVPLVTSTSTSSSTMSAVTYKPFGILFNVTPRVQVDGSIWIKLNLEVSEIAEALSYQNIPGFSSRKVNTNIILNEGTTAILSGLIQNKDVKQVEKLPLLGSIPILGELFKSRNFQQKNTELWVAITALRADKENKKNISEQIIEEKFKDAKNQTNGGLLD
jgi:pilus assembly protein CpaC